ncbi:gene transfer agent family protein [Allorhizobium sp. BGMRC 0089]|uniref:gene transfer agent family protein n=1 Tax=Allorhizobium sonneratiae TaxID=2934936 RepID=UPI002033BD5E|nr:gene transfer agent family protein [Allorhizobium sonneratiae]MCM2292296.1 gene transfer agent family protein [Allorhizobium sonneratiae]
MRDASITLTFADGDYAFRLGWGELEGLQEACDAGPYVILDRLNTGTWRVGDIAHVIRFGLIGGGKTPVEALQLVRRWVEARPPAENVLMAQAILTAGILGAPDETPGEADAANQEGAPLTIFPTEN